MNERKLQFRVGLFAITTILIAVGMIFKFGEFQRFFEKKYLVAVHFSAAPGVHQSSPVKLNGISIGKVREVVLDDQRGGVTVLLDIRQQQQLRSDTRPYLSQSLLGDSCIEFTPGHSTQFVAPGTILEGKVPPEPMKLVEKLDQKLSITLSSFDQTSLEWQKVAQNLNNIMDTNHGNLNVVVNRAAEMLQQFTTTMQTANKALENANRVFVDPIYQQNLQQSIKALPQVVNSTQQTIYSIRDAVTHVNDNLENMKNVTQPLAKHSTSIVTRLDSTLKNLDSLSGDLNQFSQLLTHQDGSLRKLVSDPHLYQNLNRSASSLAVLLEKLQPVVHDLSIFSDKIARHPELMGVRGAFRGSSGLKEPDAAQPVRNSMLLRRERK